MLSQPSGRFLKELMLNSPTFTSCLNRSATMPVFQKGFHTPLGNLPTTTNKKYYVPMSLVPMTRSSFLSRQTPTDRSVNNLPSQQRAWHLPDKGESNHNCFTSPFFSSSCLQSPFAHLLRRNPEKLGIPALHSHALRDRNSEQRPPALPDGEGTATKPQGPKRGGEAPSSRRDHAKEAEPRTRGQTPAPARAPPGPAGPRRTPCGPIAQERPRPISALPNRGRSRRPSPAARRGMPGPAGGNRGEPQRPHGPAGPPDPPGERHLGRVRRWLGSRAAGEGEGGGTRACAEPAGAWEL